MKRLIFKNREAVANQGGAMEADTISKHGRNPKSQMSRGNFKILALAVLITTVLFSVKSCKKDKDDNVSQAVINLVNEPAEFPVAEVWAEKTEIISTQSGSFDSDDPEAKPPTTKSTKASGIDGCQAYNVEWSCETKKYSASQNPDNYCMFNPMASVLWPGNLVQGESLESGVPTSIPVTKRQSGNISLALVSSGSGGATMYRTVDKMQFSYVNQAMNEILSGFSGQGYAQYNFDMDIIKSSAHLEFVLNANFAGWGATAKAGLAFNNNEEKTRVLVKLHQSYFTMVYDDPAGLDGVFTPDITVNDLRDYTGNGNPICYISSVTYGRIYYILFESTAKEDELSQALNASYKGFGVSVSVDEELKIKNTFEKTTARVFQMGGGGEGGITGGMAVNLEAIRDFMEKGINFNAQNTGAPISYTVKYLKNAKLVRMNNAMEYEIDDCTTKATPNVCPELPQLTTNEVTTFTATTATLGGNITIVGEPAYKERGVCYSATTQPPTIAHEKIIIEGTGTGHFSKIVEGLTPNTKYYVRAYATNGNDAAERTAYGEQEEFITEGTPPILTTEPEMVFVQGGTFEMGSPEGTPNSYSDEHPTHQVTLSNYSIGKYEVTQGQWLAVMGEWPGTAPSSSYGAGNDYPAYYVSWNDIVGTSPSAVGYEINGITYYQNGFCYKLSQLAGGGKQYRLPTEAEWEFAARGGNSSHGYTYSGSETVDDVAWYSGNSGSSTHPVGGKAGNELGVFDMSGNVWEWCSDWYGSTYYQDSPTENPTGPTSGSYRVSSGGSLTNDEWVARVALRSSSWPDDRYYNRGFRLACSSN